MCLGARSSYSKEYHHERAIELRKEALCYATFFGLPDPAIETVPNLNSEQMAVIKAREAKASAKKAAETKRKAEEDRVRWAQAAEQWRQGAYHHYLPYSLSTMLRIENDEVVTRTHFSSCCHGACRRLAAQRPQLPSRPLLPLLESRLTGWSKQAPTL